MHEVCGLRSATKDRTDPAEVSLVYHTSLNSINSNLTQLMSIGSSGAVVSLVPTQQLQHSCRKFYTNHEVVQCTILSPIILLFVNSYESLRDIDNLLRYLVVRYLLKLRNRRLVAFLSVSISHSQTPSISEAIDCRYHQNDQCPS